MDMDGQLTNSGWTVEGQWTDMDEHGGHPCRNKWPRGPAQQSLNSFVTENERASSLPGLALNFLIASALALGCFPKSQHTCLLRSRFQDIAKKQCHPTRSETLMLVWKYLKKASWTSRTFTIENDALEDINERMSLKPKSDLELSEHTLMHREAEAFHEEKFNESLCFRPNGAAVQKCV